MKGMLQLVIIYVTFLIFLQCCGSCESKQFAAFTRKVCIPELRVAWSRELSSGPFAAIPLVADVDADSQLDVAAVSFTGDVHVVRGADSRYDNQARWPVRLGDDVSVHSSPLQYDINDDGLLDLLICTTNAQLVFVDAFGNLINIHQVDGVWLLRDWFKHADTSLVGHDRISQFLVSDVSSVEQAENYVQLKPHVLSTPVIDDFNSDGVTEELLLAVSYYLDDVDDPDSVSTDDVTVSSLVYVNLTSLQTYLRVPLELTLKSTDRPSYLLSSATVMDIDQSTRGLETVIASSTGRLYVLNSITGHMLDNYPLSLPAPVHTQVVLDDVNMDGTVELIVQLSDSTIHCYDALSASLLWQRQLTPRPPSSTFDLRLVDLDSDLHLVVATDDGKWWVLRAGSGELVRGWPVTIARQLNTAPLITRLHPLDLTLLVGVDTDGVLHAVSLDLSCQYHVDVGETSLVGLVSRDLVPAVPGVELLVAAADGSLLCLSAGNVTTSELSRVPASSPSHNYLVFSDTMYVTIDSTQRDYTTYTFPLEISIVDTRHVSSAPYTCQVLIGSRCVHESTLLYSGSHVLTVKSLTAPLSTGHLQLRCHTRRAQLLHDTVTVTFFRTSVMDLQWLLLTPTLAMSLVLLFLLGFPSVTVLPVTLTNKRR